MQAIIHDARIPITRACEVVMKPVYVSLIDVRPTPTDHRRGHVILGACVFRCALGRGRVRTAKREGDGVTPAGRFALRRCWIRPGAAGPVVTGLPTRRTRAGDGWCDDPRHARYNRPVRLPFAASYERMWRDDPLYDIVVEIGWNDRPAIRGRGSAIFMHVALPGFTPTEGCVALCLRDLKRLIARIGPRTRLRIHR